MRMRPRCIKHRIRLTRGRRRCHRRGRWRRVRHRSRIHIEGRLCSPRCRHSFAKEPGKAGKLSASFALAVPTTLAATFRTITDEMLVGATAVTQHDVTVTIARVLFAAAEEVLLSSRPERGCVVSSCVPFFLRLYGNAAAFCRENRLQRFLANK